jgi:signal transduction histidine kinase
VHAGTGLGGSLVGPKIHPGCQLRTVPSSRTNATRLGSAAPKRPGGLSLLIAPLDDSSGGRDSAIPRPLPMAFHGRPLRDRESAVVANPPDTGARALLVAQEAERSLIARDLHGVVGGALTAVRLSLEAAERQPDVQSARAAIRESVGVLEQAIQAVRDLSVDLRPSVLDDLGLVPAVRSSLVREARRSGCQASLLTAPGLPRLAPDLESACFRVVQEALANVASHARASHIRVEIRIEGDRLVLIIDDDGVGFDVRLALKKTPKGRIQGMQKMAERVSLMGGTLDVTSRLAEGTRVQAAFPYVAARARRRAVGQ